MDEWMNLIIRQPSCIKTCYELFSSHIWNNSSENWDDCAYYWLIDFVQSSPGLPPFQMIKPSWHIKPGPPEMRRWLFSGSSACQADRKKWKAKSLPSPLSLLLKPVREMTGIKQNPLFLTICWDSMRCVICKRGDECGKHRDAFGKVGEQRITSDNQGYSADCCLFHLLMNCEQFFQMTDIIEIFLQSESKEGNNGAVVFHKCGEGCILLLLSLFPVADKSFSAFELAF